MNNISMKTETITKQVHKFGIYFNLDELKEIVESLHVTNKEGKLANFMNHFHKQASDMLNATKEEDGNLVSEEAMLQSNEGICKGGNCD